ncbi:unnamed protein product [Rotaria sordida]|uniref:Peptidylprolyl isomerase n=1 Tax=Rotaria sordida TaxID=392033 RepID=A0A813UWX0_9BILA|nr:unnamed protein product [Rotaria sordida]CAF0831934.1 unnamed protein product [Rotaria sordida]
MSDETHNDISINKRTSISSPNEDNTLLDDSSSSQHNHQETVLTDDTTNHFNNQSNHQENLSNIQTLDNSLNEAEAIEEIQSINQSDNQSIQFPNENNLNQISNEQDSLDQNQISSQQFHTSNNQHHADLASIDQLLSNIQHEPDPNKAQRQLDDDDIPPAEIEANDTQINHQNNESSTILQSTIVDNHVLTPLETPYEHHHENPIVPTESSLDETNNSLNESQLNSTDNLPLNESEKAVENDGPLVESTLDETNDSSIESQSNLNDNSSLNESEKTDEDNQKIDILPSESTVDQTNNSSIESESNIMDNHPRTEVETPDEDHHTDEFSPVELPLDQTNNSSIESQPNATDNLLFNESEKVAESTLDQTNNTSIESQSSSIDNSPSIESEKASENDIHLVASTVDQTNISSIETESNSMASHPETESEKVNEDDYKKEETNIPLKSYSLPDVVSETLEENRDDLISEKIELGKELTEEIDIKNKNKIVEDIISVLTERSTDIEEKLDRKSNDLNKQEEDESLLSNSKLISSEFEDVLGNKTLLKQTIVKGELNSRPTRSTMATVSYKLSLVDNLTSNIRLIESVSNEKFFVSECDIIPAIDICVQTMNRGECALIDSDIRHCYGDMGCLEKEIPSVSSNNSYRMKIELELHDWQSPVDVQKLLINERLCWGDKKRQMGNFYYRRQDYLTSLQCYNGALRFLDTDINPILVLSHENQRSILNDAFIQVENNVAQVNLLLNKYDACLHAVENVLKHDPKNVKALFRQGKAFFQLGKYDKAIQSLKLFTQVQRRNSNSMADRDKANEMILTCENKLANYQKNEKEIYQRMFKPQTEKRQTNNINQIDNTNNSWWPYIALGSAVLGTLAIVTFIKHRKTS